MSEDDEITIYPSKALIEMFENGTSVDNAVKKMTRELETEDAKRIAEVIIRKFWKEWSAE